MKKRNLAIAGMLLALLLAAGCGAKTAETASPSADTAVSASPSAAASEKAAGATVESLKLADGQYQADVKLSGGSGRASITSPAELRIADGKAAATIVWSSSTYDYMKVDGVKYTPVNTSGNSTFEIPVSAFDTDLRVTADTVAMSAPHEIDYTLRIDSATIKAAEGAGA